MRKLVLSAVFIWAVQMLFGQSLNLLNSGNTWSNILPNYSPVYGEFTETRFIRFAGDTVINSVEYKKVIQSNDSLQSNWITIGIVREDSTKGLFYTDLHWKQENLLYNYNLKLNDTVKVRSVFADEDSVSFVVTTIEDVLINDSLKKKYELIYPEYNNYTETWIESIGSLKGIFRQGFYSCMCNATSLLCCFHDDQLLYKNPDFEKCYYNTISTGIDEIQSTGFKVIPNVSNQHINLQFRNTKQRRICIYTNHGILIESFECYESSKNLSVSNYPAGLYFIVSEGENVKSQKFIKY